MNDTVAVDREALKSLIDGMYGSYPENRPMPSVLADAIFDSGILRDVREVEHEHGERIADAVMPKLVDVYGTNGFPVRLLRQALGYVISPVPEVKP